MRNRNRMSYCRLALLMALLPCCSSDPNTHVTGSVLGLDGRSMPLVIAHRGASGYVPEHTIEAYMQAIVFGADCIETDLVMTKDGVMIARHDNLLNLTTNVAEMAEFGDRKTTKTVDGKQLTGWFSEDFTLAEIKRLRAVERIPKIRPANVRYDGKFLIPTLGEILALAQTYDRIAARHICLYIETKHPTYFDDKGFGIEEALVAELGQADYTHRSDPVYIESFEISGLKKIRGISDLKLVQLLNESGKPYDMEKQGIDLSYQQMATPEGLKMIATYADVVAPDKSTFILPLDAAGNLDPAKATSFVTDAHQAGLLVHPFTFRVENKFLPKNLKSAPAIDSKPGDLAGEITPFLKLGVDGFFVDNPDIGVRVRDALAGKSI